MQGLGSLFGAGLGIAGGINSLGIAKAQQQMANDQEQASNLITAAGNTAIQVAQNALPTGPGIGPAYDIMAGQQQQQAYDEEANWLSQEAGYATETSLLQAAQNDYQVQKAKADQDAAFSASGVTLAGSPLAVLTETQVLGDQVSNQQRLQGRLQAQLLTEQGLQMLRQGSAAAFAGQANALNDQYQFELQHAQAEANIYGQEVQNYASGIQGKLGAEQTRINAMQTKAAATQGIFSAGALGLSGLFSAGGSQVGQGFLQGLRAPLGSLGASGGGGGAGGFFDPLGSPMGVDPSLLAPGGI